MPQASMPTIDSRSTRPPKVFISYSWTSLGHQDQVRQWAERLLSDGINVVIDVFDLKEGHDKYAFMERMVTDDDITHVLVISDKAYMEKANSKKAGVGTESQIISSEVYAKVDQSKFIPIACEFSDEREPYLPVFLKSRIYIDFSSPEASNQNWERLVRLLHGKPAYQKPQIGKPPAYVLADPASPASPAVGKFATFKQAFLTNAKGLHLYRDDFLNSCISYADGLRVRTPPDASNFGQKVLEDCGTLKVIRDHIVDWILLEGDAASTDEFRDALVKLLEDMRELKARPTNLNQFNEAWFDAHSVFVYETFLYIDAALLKKGSYAVLHELFTTKYLLPEHERYNGKAFDNFGCFWGRSQVLQTVLSPDGIRFYSPAAELIKRQADRTDLTFLAIIEAELLIMLASLIAEDTRWIPQTSYYNSQRDFPFFVRATQHRHFLKLATITGISDANVLRTTAQEGYKRSGLNQNEALSMLNYSLWECMNMSKLDSLP